jgi:hypothetical protein
MIFKIELIVSKSGQTCNIWQGLCISNQKLTMKSLRLLIVAVLVTVSFTSCYVEAGGYGHGGHHGHGYGHGHGHGHHYRH